MKTLNQKYFFCQNTMLQCLMEIDIWDQTVPGCSSPLPKHGQLIWLSTSKNWGECELARDKLQSPLRPNSCLLKLWESSYLICKEEDWEKEIPEGKAEQDKESQPNLFLFSLLLPKNWAQITILYTHSF